MKLPEALISQVREGNAVLFLGSGASRDARLQSGSSCPTGPELAKLLSTRFLKGMYAHLPLTQVSEYAISEHNLGDIQNYIASLFATLQPTPAHGLVPGFNWYGLATTNYDRLIEDAYKASNSALQKPAVLIEDTDNVDELLRDPLAVPLVKLHGCISRVGIHNPPLILTTDQYIQHRKGRSKLFDQLSDWAASRPFIFVGHSLQDTDLRAVLLQLTKLDDFRPRSFLIAPDVDDVMERHWGLKKVTTLKGTFSDLMRSLESAIPSAFRQLGAMKAEITHPIEARFTAPNAVMSPAVRLFLESDVDYVRVGLPTEPLDPKQFYRGVNHNFSATEQGLDVRRRLCDSILTDYFLRTDGSEPNQVETILVKAHAGAGKSVLLRRMAWDAANEFNSICLFLKPHGLISVGALQELLGLVRQRIYLFVDDAADRIKELHALLQSIGPEGRMLTVVLGERINEWNVQGASLAPYLDDEYELKYMSMKEIDALLGLLQKNNSLGTLEELSPEKRKEALAEHAGRQLLVALHEATLGDSFVKILLDEYRSIVPPEAQQMYLTICVLNRLDVPVRAGVISRIHGIPFEDFKRRFFAPLEHVVFAEYDPVLRDFEYRARHPHIADIVFLNVLADSEERFDAYVRCLRALNIAFAADRKAFWKMTRGRTLISLFPNQQMVLQLFAIAKESVGGDAHLIHQMALYEMNKQGPDLVEAMRLLTKANHLAPYDATIKHSIAELKLKSAQSTSSLLERDKLFGEAAALTQTLLRSERTNSHPYHTLIKVGLGQLQVSLKDSVSDIELQKLVRDVEKDLFDAQQRFPGDSYLLEAEANLGALLKNDERARTALEKAFEINQRSSFVALRLAAIYEKQSSEDAATRPESIGKAKAVLERGLEANNGELRLHFALAKLMLDHDNGSPELIAYHLQRAFTPGDANHEAQLLYGRQLFLLNRLEESRVIFKSLFSARVAPQIRNKVRHPILGKIFEGRVVKREYGWGFIARDGAEDWIYLHSSHLSEVGWDRINIGDRVRFQVGFTLRGPTATAVSLT